MTYEEWYEQQITSNGEISPREAWRASREQILANVRVCTSKMFVDYPELHILGDQTECLIKEQLLSRIFAEILPHTKMVSEQQGIGKVFSIQINFLK